VPNSLDSGEWGCTGAAGAMLNVAAAHLFDNPLRKAVVPDQRV